MAEPPQPPEIDQLRAMLSVLTASGENQHNDIRNRTADLLNGLLLPPQIAVAGEFSSGKSTLVNLLAGKTLIETSILANALPPIFFEYGDEDCLWSGRWDNPELVPIDGQNIKIDAVTQADFLRVATPAGILKTAGIIDLPGLNDPGRDPKCVERALRRANGLIWCTNAAHAWRETERHECSRLPKALASNAFLVLTHVDLRAVQPQLPRLLGRLEREAGPLFKGILPFSAPQAVPAIQNGRVTDPEVWKKAGGEAIWAAFEQIEQTARTAQIAAARDFLTEHADLTARLTDEAISREPIDIWLTGLGDIIDGDPPADEHALLSGVTQVVERVAMSLENGSEQTWLIDEFRELATELLSSTNDGPYRHERFSATLMQLARDIGSVGPVRKD